MIIRLLKRILAKARYYRNYRILFSKKHKQKYKHMPPKARSLIISNAQLVLLAEKVGISFNVTDEQILFAHIPMFDNVSIKFILDKKECFQLLDEQFVHRTGYNFIFDKSVIAIDIGMNVGDTALFFAANPYVEKVYSYELMPQIYNRALKNFKLNPEIMNKIVHNNYGLGKDDQKISVPYFDNFDLGNGLFNDSRRGMFTKEVLTTCEIKNILNELQAIVEKHADTVLYLKIDAEGAEYEIVDAVFQSELSSNIRYIAIEYHFGIQNIINILKANHFEVIESFICIDGDVNNKVGSIQAVRQCIE